MHHSLQPITKLKVELTISRVAIINAVNLKVVFICVYLLKFLLGRPLLYDLALRIKVLFAFSVLYLHYMEDSWSWLINNHRGFDAACVEAVVLLNSGLT